MFTTSKPISNKCNVGHGFVKLTTPEAALKLYKTFHAKPWAVFNSPKICEITYACLQLLEALKEHLRNSKFACDNDEYMPAVFSPARDGRQLTEPVSIEGRVAGLTRRAMELHNRSDQECLGGASSTTASTQAPSDHGGDEEDEVTEGGTGGRGDETGGSCDDDDDDDGILIFPFIISWSLDLGVFLGENDFINGHGYSHRVSNCISSSSKRASKDGTYFKTHGGARAGVSAICFPLAQLSDDNIPFHLVTLLWDTYLAEGDALPEFLVYISVIFLLTISSYSSSFRTQNH